MCSYLVCIGFGGPFLCKIVVDDVAQQDDVWTGLEDDGDDVVVEMGDDTTPVDFAAAVIGGVRRCGELV